MAGLDDLRKTNRGRPWLPHKWDQEKPTYPGNALVSDEIAEAASCACAMISSGAFEADQWDAIVDAKLREIRDRTWGSNNGSP